MAFLVALTGLCGVGKSTAARELKLQSGGEIVYLGNFVLRELDARGLSRTAENEKSVRFDIRSTEGIAGLAVRASPEVRSFLDRGIPVILDAIFAIEEYEVMQHACGASRTRLLAIDAPFDMRCARLQTRPDRPFTREEILKRDEAEIANLGTTAVGQSADYSITNSRTESAFKEEVATLWRKILSDAVG